MELLFALLVIVAMVGCAVTVNRSMTETDKAAWVAWKEKQAPIVAEKREIERERRRLEEERKKQENKSATKAPINSAVDLEDAKKVWRWMTLAGGTDPILNPILDLSEDGKRIIFKKKGYDLWRSNLDGYYNGTVWGEREKALERFAIDLFGEYAEEMSHIISIEYIADHLIKLEPRTASSCDFTLTYEIVLLRPYHEVNLLEIKRELYQTPILTK